MREGLARGVFAIAVGFIAIGLPSCTASSTLRGRIDGLSSIADNAEKSGAMKCAPRELALARSHIEFAKSELDQGEFSNAVAHVNIADPNAHAALANSPPDRCAARSFITPKVGDRDGDGIPDTVDKCPDQPENYNGFEDEDGCPDDPDTDGDGIPDSKDQCVMEPEDKDGYLDDDGCPDLDNDADGIPDAVDKCPNKPEDFDGFQDEDGCPDPDNDGDTVLDVNDFCPNTPGPPGGDRPGCPKKNMLVVVTAHEIRITQQIQFEFNKATIKGDVSFKILDEIVQISEGQPEDQPRGARPHRQRRERRVQRAPVAVARRLGAGLSGQPRHRSGPPRLEGLRNEETLGPEQQRSQPRPQPARPVHKDRDRLFFDPTVTFLVRLAREKVGRRQRAQSPWPSRVSCCHRSTLRARVPRGLPRRFRGRSHRVEGDRAPEEGDGRRVLGQRQRCGRRVEAEASPPAVRQQQVQPTFASHALSRHGHRPRWAVLLVA